MSFSDEDIFAFLLGEADEALRRQISEKLKSDSELVARVCHLRSSLNHLSGSGGCFEPPSGLVESTIQRVVAGDSSSSGPRLSSPKGFWKNPASRHRWADSIALTVSLVALCCLFLPSIVSIRFETRRIQCAENLRQNGRALIEFAGLCPQNRFPAVAENGPEAFSGVFAVRLHQVGLLGSPRQLRCISIPRPNASDRSIAINLSSIPTIEQLHKIPQAQLVRLQQALGGDYAYNLGFIEQRKLKAPQNKGRRYFAILADAPIISQRVRRLSSHDGRGVNILFDDGHVEFVSRQILDKSTQRDDEPFCNRNGENQAGLDESDASLAPSNFSPLGR